MAHHFWPRLDALAALGVDAADVAYKSQKKINAC
jgi:hypothetical protein